MEEFNKIIEALLEDTFVPVNPLRYNEKGRLYIGFNSKKKIVEFKKNGTKRVLNVPVGIYGQTIMNVNNKLRKRYMGDGTTPKEDLTMDCLSEAVVCVIESLWKMYLGQIKVKNTEYETIKEIKSNDKSEIIKILEEQSQEEREERLKNFIKLATSELGKSIIYKTCVNYDFDNNFKNNKLQSETIVKYVKNENGKTVLQYQNIYHMSIEGSDTEEKDFDDLYDIIDYTYGKGYINITERCENIVEPTENSTSGMYKYILTRYYDKLTDKQKTWFQYAIENSSNGSDFSFIKRGDENYPPRNCRSFRSYIIDKIYNLIENDEESKLYITQNRQIAWKSISEVEEKIKAILSQECKETQIDMLISILNKDNKASEMITEHLLDNDLYQPVCDVITGRMSKYKFKVIYLEKTLSCLQKLILKCNS